MQNETLEENENTPEHLVLRFGRNLTWEVRPKRIFTWMKTEKKILILISIWKNKEEARLLANYRL